MMGTRPYDYQIVHQKSLKHSPGAGTCIEFPAGPLNALKIKGSGHHVL